MLDAVLTAPAPHSGVAPIMFGDEFRVRAARNRLRFAGGAHFERLPFPSAPTGIFDAQLKIDMIDLVFHRQGEVVFAVKRARDDGDRPTRYQFTNKDHAASPGVGGFFSNVKAEI